MSKLEKELHRYFDLLRNKKIEINDIKQSLEKMKDLSIKQEKQAVAVNDNGLKLIKTAYPNDNERDILKSLYNLPIYYVKELDCLGGVLIGNEKHIKEWSDKK